MDLCERTNIVKRHPWELARLNALKTILKNHIQYNRRLKILDIGCGDAFIVKNLFGKSIVKSIDAVDINLSQSRIRQLHAEVNNIFFHNNFNNVKKVHYNLILLLDILEHIKDDKQFLSEMVDKYLNNNGYILITVPAYNFLFSSHDKFMGHYRRYNLNELTSLITNAGLEKINSGYMFFTLIPIRLVLFYYEKVNPFNQKKNKGIGSWAHGKIITKMSEIILRMDYTLAIILNKIGLKLPGLTAWIICKKQLL
jgi:SAM-dependent methyltransferase